MGYAWEQIRIAAKSFQSAQIDPGDPPNLVSFSIKCGYEWLNVLP